jgi:hypothetical protein
MEELRERSGGRFWVLQDHRGEIIVGGEPPALSPIRFDGTSREQVEIPLDTNCCCTSYARLAELWVANTVSLDQILEQLKSVPRIHSVDISETKQSVVT